MKTLLLSMTFLVLTCGAAMAQRMDPCDLYGVVYVEPTRSFADYTIYVDSNSDAFADLLVFETENRLFADRPGLWFFTTNPHMADFTVFIEQREGLADFIIFKTDTESFAGCRR